MTAIVIRGDARRLPLPDASVDLVVTSPPYYALRSYTDDGEHYAGQIGSEATPAEFLAALWECTREWVRVLKPEGSIFVNLGDKYSTSIYRGNPMRMPNKASDPAHRGEIEYVTGSSAGGMRDKSLMGLPWRYALGCTDQLGLILRAEIIWAKPNGLPESVTDRVRRSHEQVFHFTRQPRYYAAVDEIREPQTGSMTARSLPAFSSRDSNAGLSHRALRRDPEAFNPLGKLPGSVWSIPSQPLQVPARLGVSHFAAFPSELPRRIIAGWSPPGICVACGQGRRPVTTKELDLDHIQRRFRPGFIDGSEPNGNLRGMNAEVRPNGRTMATITGYACACTPCTDHPGTGDPERSAAQRGTITAGRSQKPRGNDMERVGPWREYHFDRWTPPPTRPAIVVDPFGGTGTSALVASVLGRTGISVDRSADYCRLAAWRTADPGERCRVIGAPKPPPVPDGQEAMFAP